MAVAQGNLGNAVAGHIETNKGELGYFWMMQREGHFISYIVSFGLQLIGTSLFMFLHTLIKISDGLDISSHC